MNPDLKSAIGALNEMEAHNEMLPPHASEFLHNIALSSQITPNLESQTSLACFLPIHFTNSEAPWFLIDPIVSIALANAQTPNRMVFDLFSSTSLYASAKMSPSLTENLLAQASCFSSSTFFNQPDAFKARNTASFLKRKFPYRNQMRIKKAKDEKTEVKNEELEKK